MQKQTTNTLILFLKHGSEFSWLTGIKENTSFYFSFLERGYSHLENILSCRFYSVDIPLEFFSVLFNLDYGNPV